MQRDRRHHESKPHKRLRPFTPFGVTELLTAIAVSALIMGCAARPDSPVTPSRQSTVDTFREQRAIDQLLREEQYRQAVTRATAAVGNYPGNSRFRESLVKAQMGVERLSAGPASAERVLDRMTITDDPVDGLRWYRHKYREGRTGTRMDVYIGQRIEDPSAVWMRYVPRFEGGGWLFIDGFTVVAGDHRLDRDHQRFKRDHSVGIAFSSVRPRTTTWEWVDLSVGEEEREMIPFCIDQGVGVIPWSPLARGFLAGHLLACLYDL